jgi:hypothetical protein
VPGSNGDEIGDGEAQNYTYRVSGQLVQSYLSQSDHKYIVTNGSINDFLVSSTRVLSFQEFPFGANRNTISLFGNGIYAELNNSTAQFEPGAISAVQVDFGNGTNNGAFIYGTSVPVTVTGSGAGDGVVVGFNGRLTNILNTVSVNSPTGSMSLFVDNSADPGRPTVLLNRTFISFGGPLISYGATALTDLTLAGGIGGGIYTIADTPSAPTTLRTRGSNSVFVLGNSSQLNINGQAAVDLVRIGDNGRLVSVQAPVSVTNSLANATTLVVYNSADTGNPAFTLGPTQISSGGLAISYGMNALLGLYLLGGTGTSTYTITGTPNTGATGVVLETQGNGDRVR